LIKQFFIN